MNIKISAVIAAAGSGKRMGADKNKQWILLNGVPMLARTVSVFQQSEIIDEIVIAAAKNEVGEVEELTKEYGFSKVTAVVAGGKSRQQSVYNALKKVGGEMVLVHDGARPFVTEEEIGALAEAVKEYGAAALGTKVKDTVKLVREDGIVDKTLPRQQLWAAATPQGFYRKRLLELHERGETESVTDDCMLAELFGDQVKMVLCGEQNIKLTTPEDLLFAEQFLTKKDEK